MAAKKTGKKKAAKKKTAKRAAAKKPRTAAQKRATKAMQAARAAGRASGAAKPRKPGKRKAAKGKRKAAGTGRASVSGLAALKRELGGVKGRLSTVEKTVRNHSEVLNNVVAAVEEHDRVLVSMSGTLRGIVGGRAPVKAAREPARTVMMPALH